MLRDAWPGGRLKSSSGHNRRRQFSRLEIMTEALDFEPDLIIVPPGTTNFSGTYRSRVARAPGGQPWMLRANRWF